MSATTRPTQATPRGRRTRTRKAVRSTIVAASLVVAPLVPLATTAQPAQAVATASSSTSATSLYESNWSDLMGIAMASELNQNDSGTYGPRLGELRYSGDWTRNQIVDYSAFFRDETNSQKYEQTHDFASDLWYDDGGAAVQTFGDYDGSATPVNATRSYIAVPGQPFIVVKYTAENPGGSPITWNVLDQVHLNNPSRPSGSVSASWDSGRNALFGDLTSVGGGVVALGAFQSADSYQVGDDTESNPAASDASPWYQFDDSGALGNNGSVTAADVSLAFQDSLTIAASSSATICYYITVRGTLGSAESAADTAAGHSCSYWIDDAADSWDDWMGDGIQPDTGDDGVDAAYRVGLMTIKQMQNPTIGTIPATSNPASYGYKVWARDASVTAMGLDASGHHDEADAYWRWLASVQNVDDSFHTTFDLWSGSYVSFVEPEHDSLGMFLLGAYRHYQQTSDTGFLDDIYPSLKLAADYIMSNIDGSYGFGPEDASIWEEDQEYNFFSQSMYVAGLWAAQYAAIAEGQTTDRDNWNGAASTILSAMQRSYGWDPTGLYNETGGYYNRAVNDDGTPRTLVDGSTMAAIAWGVIDAASDRARSHAETVEGYLTRDTWGISRYTGDTFYYTSPYSPAGDEAQGPEPAWPQLSMYMGLYELYTGQADRTFSRLQWYTSRTAKGYIPMGESVSWVTQSPMVSTTAEPITASAFIMTALAYQDDFEPRITPPNSNAGAYKTITVSSGTTGDWSQYSNVPYYRSATASSQSGAAMSNIDKLYITNDASNLYIRIDNDSGSLSSYGSTPKFAVQVYSEDFDHGGGISTKSTGFYGGTLERPMAFLASRWSDSTDYSHFYVTGGSWTWDHNITGVIAPQWDVDTGRVEAVIPLSELSSSGTPSTGSWAYMNIVLAYLDPSTSTWVDDDVMPIHYRLTSDGQAWLYGNEDGGAIHDVYTDKARYAPNDEVHISVPVENHATFALDDATVSVAFTSGGDTVGTTQSEQIDLGAGESTTVGFDWTPPSTDYRGYKLDVTFTDANNVVLDTAASAVDVSSDWAAFPRYGFMTDYPDQNPSESAYLMQQLNEFHINGIQFYDWQNKHHVPLAGTVASPDASWVDIAGRYTSGQTVTNQIADAHALNMVAQNYNLAYGAWAGYGEDGSGVDPGWGMFYNSDCTNQAGFTLPSGWATSGMYWFDPENEDWQTYIFNREDDVFAVYDFDGWHVDSFGDIGTVYDCDGNALDNAQGISDFLAAAKSALGKKITFNAVANFATSVNNAADLEFNYVEGWETLGQVDYSDIKDIIDTNWAGTGKPTVIAGYLDYDYAKTTTTNQKLFNDAGVRFFDSLVLASGGSHLELGEGDGMLSNEYFPNRAVAMSGQLVDSVRDLYDFGVANATYLYDPDLTSGTHTITLTSLAQSTSGEAGNVWTFSREKDGVDVLHLLNLLSATSEEWRDRDADMPAASVQTDVVVKYYYGSGTVGDVKVASPDSQHGAYQALSYTTGSDGSGSYIQFTVPRLEYWDMITVEVAR
ncbi:MAG: glycoside hydrolase family 66 protein [Protaetiibacter sp.]